MVPCLDDVEFVPLGEDTSTVFIVFILLKLNVVMSFVRINIMSLSLPQKI